MEIISEGASVIGEVVRYLCLLRCVQANGEK